MEPRGATTEWTPIGVFERERPHLMALAYRMLGSVREAEDVLQDAYLRWHELDLAGVENPAAYLTRMVARLCIDALRSAQARRMEYVGPWLPEPLVRMNMGDLTDDAVRRQDLADDLSLAFLFLLERLTPVERAVFLLHTSFDFSYAEIGRLLGKSEEACRQIAHRARKRLGDGRRRPAADPETHDALLQRFMRATREGDVDGLLELLTRDAEAYADGGGRVAAARRPVTGAENVARYLAGLARLAPPTTEFRPATVNGRGGIVTYLEGELHNVLSIDVEEGRVRRVLIVVNPDKLRRVRGARPATDRRKREDP